MLLPLTFAAGDGWDGQGLRSLMLCVQERGNLRSFPAQTVRVMQLEPWKAAGISAQDAPSQKSPVSQGLTLAAFPDTKAQKHFPLQSSSPQVVLALCWLPG